MLFFLWQTLALFPKLGDCRPGSQQAGDSPGLGYGRKAGRSLRFPAVPPFLLSKTAPRCRPGLPRRAIAPVRARRRLSLRRKGRRHMLPLHSAGRAHKLPDGGNAPAEFLSADKARKLRGEREGHIPSLLRKTQRPANGLLFLPSSIRPLSKIVARAAAASQAFKQADNFLDLGETLPIFEAIVLQDGLNFPQSLIALYLHHFLGIQLREKLRFPACCGDSVLRETTHSSPSAPLMASS